MTLIELDVLYLGLTILQAQGRQVAEVTVGGRGGGVKRGIVAAGVIEVELKSFEHQEASVG